MNLFKLVGTLAIEGVDKSKRELNDVGGTAESAGSRMISAFKKVGAAVVTYFAFDKIKDFGVNIVQAAANVQAETAQFEAAFKDLSGSATEMFQRVSEETGVFATRLQVTGTKAFSQFKGAGMDANEALEKTETFLGLASDAAAYYDISLEDAETRIRSFLRGNVEAGDAIGLFTSESQRNSYAVEMYGKKWVKLTEEQKQNLMLNVAKDIYDQAGATGQAAREADGLANVTGNLKEVWRQFLAKVGEPVLQNIVIPAMQKMSDFVTNKLMPAAEGFADKVTTVVVPAVQSFKDVITTNVLPVLKDLWEGFKKVTTFMIKWKDELALTAGVVLIFVGALKLAKIINDIGKGFEVAKLALEAYNDAVAAGTIAEGTAVAAIGFKNIALNVLQGNLTLTEALTMLLKGAQDKLNASFLASPITWVVVAIAALVAGIVVAYKKSDTFRAMVDKLFGKLKELWKIIEGELKAAFDEIKPAVDGVMDALKELWDVIKSYVAPIIDLIAEKINKRMPAIKAVVKSSITVVVTAIKNLLTIVKTVFNQIKIVIVTVLNVIKGIIKTFTAVLKGDWSGAWKSFKSIFSSIWNGIKNTASNVLGGIKGIFTNTWNGIKSATTRIWNGIKDSVTKPVKNAMEKVEKYVGKIKGFFTGFTAKMKMPHFKIKNASLNPKDWIKKGIPKLSVEWYKDGGILTEPTAFGYNPVSGAVRVGGEAGAEAVAPIDTLMGYVQTAVQAETGGLVSRMDRLLDMLAKYFPEMLTAANKKQPFDPNALAKQLAPAMNTRFGEMSRLNTRGAV